MIKKFLILSLVVAMTFSPVVASAAVDTFVKNESVGVTSLVETSFEEDVEEEVILDYRTGIVPSNKEETEITFLAKEENEKKILTIVDKNTEKEYLFFEEVNWTRYVGERAGLNFRTFPNILYDNVFKALPYSTEVKIVGISENGWALAEIEGEKYFCWEEYLTKTKPVIKTESSNNSLKENTQSYNNTNETYSPSQLKRLGVIYWGGWRWTWYSQKVLPGGGLNIPGRHVDSNGYVCDGEGYICLASGSLSKGTVVDTPFGKMGKVYDCGCAANTLDVYTNF